MLYYPDTNKAADQTAQIHRLICVFVVRIWHKSGFLITRLIFFLKFSIKTYSNDSNGYSQHMFLWRNMENYPKLIIKYPPYLFL